MRSGRPQPGDDVGKDIYIPCCPLRLLFDEGTGTNYMHTYGINFFKVFIAVPAVKSARLT